MAKKMAPPMKMPKGVFAGPGGKEGGESRRFQRLEQKGAQPGKPARGFVPFKKGK